MEFYFAPLEGITRYIFRNAYERYYKGIEKYFDPFISPTDNCFMTPKNLREVCREHNEGINLVPQILCNNSKAYIGCAKELINMGYREINFNLGCPSGTVCAKRKGAGFLDSWYELEKFFDDIFAWAESEDGIVDGNEHVKLSIKTRLGRLDPDDFYDLLEIYNNYPVSELIIHPRIEKDYYKGTPRKEYFEYAAAHSKIPIVYNGNIFSANDITSLENMLSDLRDKTITELANKSVVETAGDLRTNTLIVKDVCMLGRGLLYNPEIIEKYNNQDETDGFNYERFRAFHDELYNNYKQIMSPDKNVLFHMKELWTYWRGLFDDDSTIKNLLKSKSFTEYDICVRKLFGKFL